MAGRYKQPDNVESHPSQQEGRERIAAITESHKDEARRLRPRYLTKEQQRVWDRVAPLLSAQNRLKATFVEALAEYCVIKVRIDKFRRELDRNGWEYAPGKGRNGAQKKLRPKAHQYNRDWSKWNSLIAQFGMTPATELRFDDRQGDLFDDGDNEFDQL